MVLGKLYAKFNKKNVLVTFHPVTLEGNAKLQFTELLSAIIFFINVEHTKKMDINTVNKNDFLI